MYEVNPEILSAIEEERTLLVSTAPVVTSHQTIRVNLNRGDHGEGYVWTREEATLIRDALNRELGPLRPLNPIPRIGGDGPTMGPNYNNLNLKGDSVHTARSA